MDAQQQYVVGWGTLALINAGFAQMKGLNRLTWFIISLFLGPVATFLLVVFMPPAARHGTGPS
jgi:hypothetical protein